MRIESLDLFLSVAECRSISRAARQHFISQQGASSIIKALEADVGTALFARSCSGLQLTPQGRLLAIEAQKVVDAYRGLQAMAAAGAPVGEQQTLDIVTMPFVTNRLGAIFAKYEELVPGLRIRIIERTLPDILETFLAECGAKGELANAGVGDRAPAGEAPAPAGRPAVECGPERATGPAGETVRIVALPAFRGGLRSQAAGAFRPLVSCELMMACAWDSPWAAADYVTREQLSRIPMVCYNEEFLNRLIAHLFEGYQPDIRLHTSSIDMLNRAFATTGAATFTDSLSVYLEPGGSMVACVPIRDSVFFRVGVLGEAPEGSAAGRFVRYFERYLATVCAPYMDRYAYARPVEPERPAADGVGVPAPAPAQ